MKTNLNKYSQKAKNIGLSGTAGKADMLNTLRLKINEALQVCMRDATPYVCAMAETKQGYEALESQVIEMCIKKGITPAIAISEIESSFNQD